MVKRVLVLGYGRDQTSIPDWLSQFGEVEVTGDTVNTLAGYDHVVVYGYRHILRPNLLATSEKPPVNLHISFLPFNRGAHPNFWCWIEGTPAGISIHELDAGIDTGPIIDQRRFVLPKANATFEETYWHLRALAEETFIDIFPSILCGTYCTVPQSGSGTFHKSSDLPNWVSWQMQIGDAKTRFEDENRR